MFLYIYKYRVLRLKEVYSLKNGHNHRTLLATYTNVTVQKPTPNLATKVKVYTMTVFPARDDNFEIQGTLSNVITLSLPVQRGKGDASPFPPFSHSKYFF